MIYIELIAILSDIKGRYGVIADGGRIMLNSFGMFTQQGSIGGCVTIDSTKTDNGFLDCARAANPGASGHTNTVGAVNNLAACEASGRKPANLIGHGNDGLIVTGTGQTANDPLRYVSLWNQARWRPEFKRLRDKTSGLSLWACHPGTAAAGADFLFNLAQVINANVSGPTGFLYCGRARLWLEPHSVWQVATPTARPKPISAPSPHLTELSMSAILIREGGNEHLVDFDSIVDASYEHLSAKGTAGAVLQGDDARALASTILWERPFDPEGVPAAIATGRLRISFKIAEAKVEKSFLVYNNRLLKDEAEEQTYYHASAGFAAALINLL